MPSKWMAFRVVGNEQPSTGIDQFKAHDMLTCYSSVVGNLVGFLEEKLKRKGREAFERDGVA